VITIGLLIGIGGALLAGQYIQSVLYGVSPADLITFSSAVLLLSFAGLIACFLPALRATRINPIIVLRE
jgi:putative ABC transport system permease protein